MGFDMAEDPKAFQSVIMQLWQSLDIGEPTFSDLPSITLMIGDIDVLISEDITGQMLMIEARGGRLTNNPPVEFDEIVKVLKLNFALTASHQTYAALESSGDHEILKINASYYYSANDVRSLSELISDTVSAVETYRQIVSGELVSSTQTQRHIDSKPEEMVVFLP